MFGGKFLHCSLTLAFINNYVCKLTQFSLSYKAQLVYRYLVYVDLLHKYLESSNKKSFSLGIQRDTGSQVNVVETYTGRRSGVSGPLL